MNVGSKVIRIYRNAFPIFKICIMHLSAMQKKAIAKAE